MIIHDEAALFTQLQRFLWLNPDILHIDVAVVVGTELTLQTSTRSAPGGKLIEPMFREVFEADRIIVTLDGSGA